MEKNQFDNSIAHASPPSPLVDTWVLIPNRDWGFKTEGSRLLVPGHTTGIKTILKTQK